MYSIFVGICATANAQEYQALPEILVSDSQPNAGRSILNSENINQQQADNAASLVDVLPGVSMSGSPRPNGQNLNIWGMGDSEDIRIMLDGNPKNFERYRQGSVFIEPELLKRVEVDKGNFSARYGNGGFGGTVSFTTKDPADFLGETRQLGGLLKYGYHSNDKQNIYSGALFARNEAKTLDALFYGTFRNGQDLRRPDGSHFKYSENDNRSYLAKINWYPSENQRLSFSAVQSKSDGWQPFAAMRDELTAPSVADIDKYGEDLAWKRKLVYRIQQDKSYSLEYVYTSENPLFNPQIKLGIAETTQDDSRPDEASKYFQGSMGNKSHTRYRDRHFELMNTAIFSTGVLNHSLQMGVQWHSSKRDVLMFDASKEKKTTSSNAAYNFGWYTPSYMPSGKQYQRSFFLEDKIEWGNWLLKPALRYDYVRNKGQKNAAEVYNDESVGHDYRAKNYAGWSPYLGMQWQATKNLRFFTDVSRTWRAPVIDEQYEVQYAKASITGSSRNLKKEKITSLRLGGMWDFNGLISTEDSLQLRATYFNNRGKDEIFKTRGKYDKTQNIVANYRNLPGYRIQGVELEAYYNSTYVFASLSYSQIKGKRDASPRDPDFPQSTWIAEIPPRKASLMLGANLPAWDLALGWRADMVRRQDRSPVDNDPDAAYWALPKSEGYTIHNAFITWQPKKWHNLRVNLTVDNLFNKDYKTYLGERVSGTGRNIKMSISTLF